MRPSEIYHDVFDVSGGQHGRPIPADAVIRLSMQDRRRHIIAIPDAQLWWRGLEPMRCPAIVEQQPRQQVAGVVAHDGSGGTIERGISAGLGAAFEYPGVRMIARKLFGDAQLYAPFVSGVFRFNPDVPFVQTGKIGARVTGQRGCAVD